MASEAKIRALILYKNNIQQLAKSLLLKKKILALILYKNNIQQLELKTEKESLHRR